MAHEIYLEGAVVAKFTLPQSNSSSHPPETDGLNFAVLKRFQDRISKFQPILFQVQRLKLSGRVEVNKHLIFSFFLSIF